MSPRVLIVGAIAAIAVAVLVVSVIRAASGPEPPQVPAGENALAADVPERLPPGATAPEH